MKIDLHIHTRTGSDGALSIEEVFQEAKRRRIDLMSITDHDYVGCQERAIALAKEYGILYITGVELNVTFQYNDDKKSAGSHQNHPVKSSTLLKFVSLDFLGYQYEIGNEELAAKVKLMREYREDRARQILEKLNIEFDKENIESLPKRTLER